MKQIIIIAAIVIGIITGAIMFGGSNDQAAGSLSNNFFGQEEGVITVTEYLDFQCPACAGFYPVFSQVKEQFSDQVRFEVRHFPLVQIHPNAQAAHRASEAAANQGKFWEMHDVLFERLQSWNQSTNPANIFEDYARELGLDMDQYANEIGSSEILSTINADIAEGKSLGVAGTPTFFIDGQRIEDLTSVSTVNGFAELLQSKIDEKTGKSTSDTDTGEESEAESSETQPATRPEETVEE